MRILFDHGAPIGIAGALAGHEVTEAIDRGWDRVSNGDLLQLAEQAGSDLLLTTDKNLRYQQNMTSRKIAIVVLGNSTWRYVRPHLDRVVLAVNQAQAKLRRSRNPDSSQEAIHTNLGSLRRGDRSGRGGGVQAALSCSDSSDCQVGYGAALVTDAERSRHGVWRQDPRGRRALLSQRAKSPAQSPPAG